MSTRSPIIYLPEVPWLVLLTDPVTDEQGVAYGPCPRCDSHAPLIEDAPDPYGAMFVCLAGWGGCGQRFYVDFD